MSLFMIKRAVPVAGCVALLVLAGPALAQAPPTASAAQPPPGPGLDLMKERCVSCHTLPTIFKDHKTPDDWTAIVQTMADRGADVSPDEMKTIANYLAKTLPAAPGAAPTPGASSR